MKIVLALLFAALSASVAAENPTQQFDAALQLARQRHVPVLVDFHAPWCYSCYYMKKNVLNGAEWERAERSSVVLELDADAPEGAYWKQLWNVKALPSYVVLNEHGDELGRITAEQTRADFYRQLGIITGKQTTLESLQAQVLKGGMASIVAMREILKTYHARRAAVDGLSWMAALPSSTRNTVQRDLAVQRWMGRLELQKAILAHDHKACIQIGTRVLKEKLGCEFPYELDSVMACAADLPPTERSSLFTAQRARMDALVQSGAFGKSRCADQRSVVLTAADLYAALDDKKAEAEILSRALADTRKKIGGELNKDRNLADNLRVYLDRAGDLNAYDALMPQLIAAYPDDYVYAYRYGKSLLARGQAAAALPFLEQSAEQAYGINRLKVAEQRVLALQALKRDDEARKIVSAVLKANGPWFPEDAQKLKALVL